MKGKDCFDHRYRYDRECGYRPIDAYRQGPSSSRRPMTYEYRSYPPPMEHSCPHQHFDYRRSPSVDDWDSDSCSSAGYPSQREYMDRRDFCSSRAPYRCEWPHYSYRVPVSRRIIESTRSAAHLVAQAVYAVEETNLTIRAQRLARAALKPAAPDTEEGRKERDNLRAIASKLAARAAMRLQKIPSTSDEEKPEAAALCEELEMLAVDDVSDRQTGAAEEGRDKRPVPVIQTAKNDEKKRDDAAISPKDCPPSTETDEKVLTTDPICDAGALGLGIYFVDKKTPKVVQHINARKEFWAAQQLEPGCEIVSMNGAPITSREHMRVLCSSRPLTIEFSKPVAPPIDAPKRAAESNADVPSAKKAKPVRVKAEVSSCIIVGCNAPAESKKRLCSGHQHSFRCDVKPKGQPRCRNKVSKVVESEDVFGQPGNRCHKHSM